MKRNAKVKTVAARRLRQIKVGKLSLQVKCLLLLAIFAVAMTLANVCGVGYNTQKIFSDYFKDQLADKYDGVKDDILGGTSGAEAILAELKGTYRGALDAAIVSRDYDRLDTLLRAAVAVGGYSGYVLSSTSGDVWHCHFKSGNRPENVFAALGDPEVAFSDLNLLPGRGLCATSSLIYNNAAGSPAMAITIVMCDLYDNNYLDVLKFRYKADVTVFDGSTRMATTVTDRRGERLVGTSMTNKEILDTVYHRGKRYIGEAVVGDKDYFVEYLPVRDKAGEVCAMLYLGVEAEVSTTIATTLADVCLIGSMIVSVVLTVLSFIYIRKHVTLPIRSIANSARKIAEKDLSEGVKAFKTGDEIEFLAACVGDMHESLKSTIEEMQDASESLRASSDELSRASLGLSDGANKQAASLEEIASSIEEMTASIKQNTHNSHNTERLIMQTDKAIGEISKMSEDNKIASQKIAGAISDINSLVNQTNILSLNASVEAARAGNSGRGFAVVAKEVGRLAEQTRMTAASVSQTADESIDSAVVVDAKLEEVTPHLTKVVGLMKEITQSCEESGLGAEHINIAIADLNKTTQNTAANAEEIAANAEELAGTAEHLHDVVKQFKV